VRCDPEEAMGYVVLSDALQETGDEAGALQAARHAIELAPEDPAAHNQLGLVLLEHDRAAEGAQAFRTALGLDAEHDLALNNLAVARLRMGERDAALTEFEAAARLDPRSDVVRQNVLAVGGRARVYRRLAIAFGIAGLVALTADVLLGLGLLAVAVVFEVVRRGSLSELSAPTHALVLDDARARRFKPQRWDWSWPTRLRPWWWLLLMQIPPPIALLLNVVAFAAAVGGRSGGWTILLGIGLPFSAWRAWRWWRRRHPGRRSWRPPDA
jgi:tetratricopeptide (TPR) repeat protein